VAPPQAAAGSAAGADDDDFGSFEGAAGGGAMAAAAVAPAVAMAPSASGGDLMGLDFLGGGGPITLSADTSTSMGSSASSGDLLAQVSSAHALARLRSRPNAPHHLLSFCFTCKSLACLMLCPGLRIPPALARSLTRFVLFYVRRALRHSAWMVRLQSSRSRRRPRQ